MVYEILAMLRTCIGACRDWFLELLGATGMTSFYLAMVFIALVGRFFLSPIFGIAMGVALGSDMANKKRPRYYGDPNQKRLGGK